MLNLHTKSACKRASVFRLPTAIINFIVIKAVVFIMPNFLEDM